MHSLLIFPLVLVSLGAATFAASPERHPHIRDPQLAKADGKNCICGEWCCRLPNYHCGHVEMAGGWSCFPNERVTTSLTLRATTTSSSPGISPKNTGLPMIAYNVHGSEEYYNKLKCWVLDKGLGDDHESE